MKHFFSVLHRALERMGGRLQSKASLVRRALLSSEARERAASEAERLDRLRHPRDYQGR